MLPLVQTLRVSRGRGTEEDREKPACKRLGGIAFVNVSQQIPHAAEVMSCLLKETLGAAPPSDLSSTEFADCRN